MSYRFGQVSFSGTGRTEKEDVFALLDEATRGELAYDSRVDGRIEREVEGLQGLTGIGMGMT